MRRNQKEREDSGWGETDRTRPAAASSGRGASWWGARRWPGRRRPDRSLSEEKKFEPEDQVPVSS